MATQSTMTEFQRPGVPGAKVNMIPATIISRDVQDVAGIGFGIAVYQGTADKSVTATVGTAATFVGFTMLDRSVAQLPNAFAQGESARVMTEGALWVISPAIVAAGAAVVLGGVTIPRARWDTSTTATNQLAQLRLI